MLSGIVLLVMGITQNLLLADWSKARLEENPERYQKYAGGFWDRLSKWEGRYFRNDLTSRQLGRRMRIAWVVTAGLLLVSLPIDFALQGWEATMFSPPPF